VLATIALASVLRLAYASYVVLKVVCLLCLGTYACVIGILVVSAMATSIPVIRLPRHLFRDLRSMAARPILLTVALLYLGGVATAVAFFPREMQAPTTVPPPPAQDEQARFAAAWAQQPRIDLGIPAAGAKVVIVKFNDWLCPTCKFMHFQYQPVLDKYAKSDPGAVKYVLKDFPWCKNCNALIAGTIPGHESSCEAAAAVRMARNRGKADAMIEWLFANQDHLVELNKQGSGSAEVIKAKVKELLGIADFDREYATELPLIRQDAADGIALKIGGTPAYYVNGVAISTSGNLPPEYLDMAIRIELKRAG
jgi:protein-disulfide isomerase